MKYIFILFLKILEKFCDYCKIWDDDYYCKGGKTIYGDSWDEHAFQTPPRNDIYGRYKSTYQDMHYLVGYTQLKYSSDKNYCTIKIITKVNPKLGEEGKDYYFIYNYGDNETMSDTIILNSENGTYPNGMSIIVKLISKKNGNEIVKLELEDEYFIWDNQKINQSSEYENGQKGSIVELFGWPYEDISEECEFLSNAGYMGIKIYSPNEHLLTYEMEENGELNPWWYINQPVSFKLHSRMGDKKQLKNMINICRSYNLRIYADVIINHMTGNGYDTYDDHLSESCAHWGARSSSGGSPFWTVGFRYENNPYTNKEPALEYPAVPYFPTDFHCKKDIYNWNDGSQLTNGWISGMADVNTEKEYVQQRIADFFTELISIGMSGVSIPNSKHILPSSFVQIFKKLKDNLGGEFPEDFIAILQLQYGWEKDLVMCNDSSPNSFGIPFKEKLESEGFTEEDIIKIKIWNSGFSKGESPNCDGQWKVEPERHALSIEYPDDINLQNYYYIYIRDKDIDTHRNLIIEMFSNLDNNWKIKSVFSMFSLYNGIAGFPDGKSDCSMCQSENCKKYCSKSFPYQKAYDPISKGYDTGNNDVWKEGTYTRVHRDKGIINAMREWMNFTIMEDDEIYNKERIKADCNEKCLICNDESKKDDLCLICNITKGFYPVINPRQNQKYYECLNSSLIYERLYFDEKERAFKPCYETCKVCEKEGDPKNHNCKACENNLIPRTNDSDSFNCVTNCSFSYYFTSFGQYKCTEIAFCPKEANLYIEEKNKCIDNCKNDPDFQYLFNGNCLKNCPQYTMADNDYICRLKDYDNCTISEKEIKHKNIYN